MGTVQKKYGKYKSNVTKAKKIDRDIKECMRCKYFHGNNSQCISSRCVKEEKKIPVEKTECTDCPYSKGHGLCFPCMKKILGHKLTT